MVEDFPLRGKIVLLQRRLDKTTQKVIYRDWNLVAQGTRMTVEFAVFLKNLISTKAIDCHTIASFYGLKGKNYNVNLKII